MIIICIIIILNETAFNVLEAIAYLISNVRGGFTFFFKARTAAALN